MELHSIKQNDSEVRLSENSLVNHSLQISLERLEGLLSGISLGDSLGLPVETFTREEIAEKFGRIVRFESNQWNQFLVGKNVPPGTCSDDAQLTAAVLEAIIAAHGFSLAEIGRHHVRALEASDLGWGESTKRGVLAFAEGLTPGTAEFVQRLGSGLGNGIPMKVSGLAMWAAIEGRGIDSLIEPVRALCSLSHPNSVSVSAGLAHCAAIIYCLFHDANTFEESEFVESIVSASMAGHDSFPGTFAADILSERLESLQHSRKWSEEEIIEQFGAGRCTVFDSLPYSYAFFLRNWHSVEALFDVVNAGGDTDSNGALVGGLLGALHGSSVFPAHLLAGVHGIKSFLGLGSRLLDAFPPPQD